MAITFDEVAQTVINLVRHKEFLEERIKQLEAELAGGNKAIKNVREPDNKRSIHVAEATINTVNKESK